MCVPVVGDPATLGVDPEPARVAFVAIRSRCARSRDSSSGSGRPWGRQTIIGVRHTRQSVTQHSSSSKCQSVTRSARQRRQSSLSARGHASATAGSTMSPTATPRIAEGPRPTSTAPTNGSPGPYEEHGSPVHGSMSRIEMIRPWSSQNAIESGIACPSSRRCLDRLVPEERHPVVRLEALTTHQTGPAFVAVSATWTSSVTVPPEVRIESPVGRFGSGPPRIRTRRRRAAGRPRGASVHRPTGSALRWSPVSWPARRAARRSSSVGRAPPW